MLKVRHFHSCIYTVSSEKRLGRVYEALGIFLPIDPWPTVPTELDVSSTCFPSVWHTFIKYLLGLQTFRVKISSQCSKIVPLILSVNKSTVDSETRRLWLTEDWSIFVTLKGFLVRIPSYILLPSSESKSYSVYLDQT